MTQMTVFSISISVDQKLEWGEEYRSIVIIVTDHAEKPSEN
jgi:hypothetical protein